MERPLTTSAAILRVLALVAVVAALATIRRPFMPEGLASGHDASTHVNYAYRFDRALHQGQFPVRWVEAYEPGRGQPLFNFYQVGFYYAVDAVHVVIARFSRAYKWTIVLLWWAGACFVFLAMKRVGTLPAALGAVVFAISPYLAFDTLGRAAFPEFTGIMAGAGVLWGLDRLLFTGRWIYVVTTAFCAAALAVSHLPTAVMLTVMFGIHAATMLAAGETNARRLWLIVPAGVLAAGLAAFYVLPALGELRLIQIHSMTEGRFDFHNNFMSPAQWFDFKWKFGGSTSDPNDYMPLQVGIVQWAAIFLALAVIAVDVYRRRVSARAIGLAGGLAVAGAGMFMATAASRPIWDHIAPLAYVQFPYRFLMLLPFAGALLTARLLSAVDDRRIQALVVIAVTALDVGLYASAMNPQSYISRNLVNPDTDQWPYYSEARREFIEPAYYPAGVTTRLAPTPRRWSVEGDGVVKELVTTDAHRVLEATSERGVTIVVNTPYFPGWAIDVDGVPTAPRVRPVDAYMEVPVRAGTHQVEATFGDTPMRLWANFITGATAELMCALGALPLVARLRRPRSAR